MVTIVTFVIWHVLGIGCDGCMEELYRNAIKIKTVFFNLVLLWKSIKWMTEG
jgi:hypothetical protein